MPKTIKALTYTIKVNDAAQDLINKLEMWINEEEENLSYALATSGFTAEEGDAEIEQHEQRVSEAKKHIEYIKENLTLYDLEI